MKKIFKNILILVVVIGIFLSPISISLNNGKQKSFVKFHNNQAKADNPSFHIFGIGKSNDTVVTSTSAKFSISLYQASEDVKDLKLIVNLFEGSYSDSNKKAIPPSQTLSSELGTNGYIYYFHPSFTGLTPDTNYSFNAILQNTKTNSSEFSQAMDFTTSKDDTTSGSGTVIDTTTGEAKKYKAAEEVSIGCALYDPSTWFTNCLVAALYNVLFRPLAALAEWSAGILDFFIFYSISSDAYQAYFIEKGWSAVRDIANIFFIIVLLYIAIKTILGINTSNNKKYIAYTVIFALLINFSLFTTRVVIDSSNILARIFYNQIEQKDRNGSPTEKGEMKSVTVLLAQTMSPKDIIQADVGGIEDHLGEFTLITIFAIIACGFMIYVFLGVALLFVARVVSLWISMITSPLAFMSYALPFSIKKFGYKDWWPNLFASAFLAPIFIFFLYIILMFGKSLPGVHGDFMEAKGWLNSLVKLSIPFALMIILILSAKKLAKEFSGEIGEMIMKGAKTLGGFAVGAVAGGTALLAGGVIGGGAGMLGKTLSKYVGEKGMSGYMARLGMRATNKLSKSSFDARSGLLGQKLGQITGMNLNSASMIGLGTEKTKGGFTARKEREIDRLMKESELYKTKMSDSEVKDWSEKQQAKYDAQSAEYKAKHERPKTYTSAAQLNVDRLNAFKDNLGQSGLMGSLAHTILNATEGLKNKDSIKNTQAYQDKLNKKGSELTAEEINTLVADYNKDLVKKLKLGLGAGAIALTGGIAGAGYGALAGAGVMGGGGIGGWGQSMVESAAEKEVAKKIGKMTDAGKKEQGKIERGAERKEEIEDFIKRYTDSFGAYVNFLKEEAKKAGKSYEEYVDEYSTELNKNVDEIKQRESSSKRQREEAEREKADKILSGVPENDISISILNRKIDQFRNEELTAAAEYLPKFNELNKLNEATKGKNRMIQFEKELRELNQQEATAKEKLEKTFATHESSGGKHGGNEGSHGGGGGNHGGGSHNHSHGGSGINNLFSSRDGGNKDHH